VKKRPDYIRRKLIESGIPQSALSFDDANRRTPLGGQIGNMVLKLPGTIRGPRRMLSAHVDTVPICIGSRPVRKGKYVVSANKETGLGADDRSGAAILLTTVLAINKSKLPHPPLTFLWAVQEEVGLFGARYVRLSKLGKPGLAFNFDGGENRRDRRLSNDD
jgi:tripeptide aminopeptidase